MISARSKRRHYVVLGKTATFLLICLAPNAAADSGPLASQPAESPEASTIAGAQQPLSGIDRESGLPLTSLSRRELRTIPAGRIQRTRRNAVRPRLEHNIPNLHESCIFGALQDTLPSKPVSGKLQSPQLVMKHRRVLRRQIKVEDIS